MLAVMESCDDVGTVLSGGLLGPHLPTHQGRDRGKARTGSYFFSDFKNKGEEMELSSKVLA